MRLPIVLVDSAGNAMPLSTQGIKAFILYSLRERMRGVAKKLDIPMPQIELKPLSNRIKALQYQAKIESTQHLHTLNANANALLDSIENMREQTRLLLPYHKGEDTATRNELIRQRLVDMRSASLLPRNETAPISL